MKAYTIVYLIGKDKAEMKVYANNLSDAQTTAKTLLKGRKCKILGIVETLDITHEKVMLCDEVI